MPVVLDATPGSLTANSFVSRAEADAIMLGQLFSDNDWENADPEQKDRALITATRLIIDAVGNLWLGRPVSSMQVLPFPRYGVMTLLGPGYYPSNVIPYELKRATAEYARQLINLGRMPDTPSDTAGLKSLEAGPVSLVFDESFRPTSDLPPSVWSMIRFLTGSYGSVNRPVYRT